MLNSRAVAAIREEGGQYYVYIRTTYLENLGIHAFSRWRRAFPSEPKAMIWFKTSHPQGFIVAFEDLAKPDMY